MPVTLDNLSATVSGAAVSMTLALTIASSAKALVVFTGSDNSRSISALTWNGTSLTRLTGLSTSSRNSELWVLTAPAAGSFNVVANWVGSGGTGLFALSYNNVKASGGFGTPVAASAAAAATVNMSLSSTNTDLCVGYFAYNTAANAVTINNGTTRRSLCCSTTIRMVVADIAGAASITLSATAAASGAWVMLGVPLVFSATAAGGSFVGSLAMLGAGA